MLPTRSLATAQTHMPEPRSSSRTSSVATRGYGLFNRRQQQAEDIPKIVPEQNKSPEPGSSLTTPPH